MKKIFYYNRDNFNVPVITVCLIKWRTVVCRGIAICSPLDNPEKKNGRRRAEGRAMSAYKNRATTKPVYRPEAIDVLYSTESELEGNYYDIFKSTYKPELTEYEKTLLTKV